ncbi:TlyA family RNA methyltransferase [Acidobacteria bacterium AH-259-D05]|nr:TlyA family RNA methyltransferase [Acidobacteria bacterium AH-259-D05]
MARQHDSTKKRKRLDALLVERGIAEDHKKATAITLSGLVLVDEQRIDKPGTLIQSTSKIRLKSKEGKYVSRGGIKLEAALREFGVQVEGKVCLDLGASTGGFTDCLLQHGARRVYAFDVGSGQLHWNLQQDSRVVAQDSINVRYLTPSMIDDPVALITLDLAFISLRLIFPRLKQFPSANIISLVKPQFEARREEVEAGGIIHSRKLQKQIVHRVKEAALNEGLTVVGEMASPLEGKKGNQEYFLFLRSPRRLSRYRAS